MLKGHTLSHEPQEVQAEETVSAFLVRVIQRDIVPAGQNAHQARAFPASITTRAITVVTVMSSTKTFPTTAGDGARWTRNAVHERMMGGLDRSPYPSRAPRGGQAHPSGAERARAGGRAHRTRIGMCIDHSVPAAPNRHR